MRFCPFCSAENADELATCQACGRRLPPLPPRRARNAPPTGVQLPLRTGGTTQPPPLRAGGTTPPPLKPMLPTLDPTAPPFGGASGRGHAANLEGSPPLPTSITGRTKAPSLSPPSESQRIAPQSSAGAGPLPSLDHRARSTTVPPLLVAPHGDAKPVAQPVPTSSPAVAPHGDARASAPSLPPPPAVPPARGAFDDDSSTMQSAPIFTSVSAPKPGSGDVPGPSLPPRPAPPAPGTPVVGAPVLPPLVVTATTTREVGITPPPTRATRPEALADRPFTPPRVSPVPEIPEDGLVSAARYAIRFGRARWQRRAAIKTLDIEIKQDTEALDQVLGALGRVARNVGVESRVFSAENTAITEAEARIEALSKELGDVDARKGDENSKFVEVERERTTRLGEVERLLDEAQKEVASLEGQRRAVRESRKSLERRQKTYLKEAEENDRQAGSAQMGDSRGELRRSAEVNRKEAAAIEPERQECDRRLAALERPVGDASAKLDVAKAELDVAKRSLADVREGHTHRLAELDAEQKRKARDIGLAQGEIARRLVTLGTLINLNRVENAAFTELYERIDRLRGAITARTTEIEKLTAEREAYDRPTLTKGLATMGGAVVLFIAFIVILRAIL